ncbi:MAG: RNA methyltransferase [Chitinophagales bacterium]
MLSKATITHLQDLKQKKYRQKYAEFVIAGEKLVTEALLARTPVKYVIATEAFQQKNKGLLSSVHVELTDENTLSRISSLTTVGNAIAVLPHFPTQTVAPEGKWFFMLDGISDPGNMGTIIRIADWFGMDQVICTPDCVELYNPKTVQATMGALFRVQVEYYDPVSFLAEKKFPVYAASMEGENVFSQNDLRPGCILIGSESHGIREACMPLITKELHIPGAGRGESLNAAVAAGIIAAQLMHGD